MPLYIVVPSHASMVFSYRDKAISHAIQTVKSCQRFEIAKVIGYVERPEPKLPKAKFRPYKKPV